MGTIEDEISSATLYGTANHPYTRHLLEMRGLLKDVQFQNGR
jgi:hypothetical protein